jgi:predicted RND superfamily exporter protein
MWYRLGQNILKYKKTYLFFILLSTVVMGYFAAQIKLSYEYTKAIPSDNPKFIVYNEFVKKYGVDGTTVVVGFETDHFYSKDFFNQVDALHKTIKQNSAVAEVMSIPTAYTITKDSIDTKFNAAKIFNAPYTSDSLLLADQTVFENLPFYQNLLYNPDSNSYIMAISFIADSINSVSRTKIIGSIQDELDRFSQSAKTEVHISGLPFIRTIMADRIKKEMLWFLIGSLIF